MALASFSFRKMYDFLILNIDKRNFEKYLAQPIGCINFHESFEFSRGEHFQFVYWRKALAKSRKYYTNSKPEKYALFSKLDTRKQFKV